MIFIIDTDNLNSVLVLSIDIYIIADEEGNQHALKLHRFAN